MSHQVAIQQLAVTLNTNLSELNGLAVLQPQQLHQLNTLIVAAQQKQRATLNNAIEEGLSYVPALLRGAVKAIVRG